jgi:nicotinate-nucleotide adenylyltransferase
MIDTVHELQRQRPGGQPVLILGADQASALPSWERVDELLAIVEICIVTRGEEDPSNVAKMLENRDCTVTVCRMPAVDVSSSHLRDLLSQTGSAAVQELVPAGVRELLDPFYSSL